MRITQYEIRSAAIGNPLTFALLTDLHSRIPDRLYTEIRKKSPDIIAIAGDFIDGSASEAPHMLEFLSGLASLCPCYYSTGNHELFTDRDKELVRRTGTVLLDDSCELSGCGIYIGGISSGFGFSRQSRYMKTPAPDLGFLKRFSSLGAFRLLLSHHPEYYPEYIRKTGIDLVFSGHAHGGQWRFFGQGIFAPGQGLFPEYTRGLYDRRLVVSAGLGGHTVVPRIFNPEELVFVRLMPEDSK